jgi:hypothetical protein
MSLIKNFKNSIPLNKRKKEISLFLIITTLLVSLLLFFTYYRNSPLINPDLPRINITVEGELNNDEFKNCTFELISNDVEETISPLNSKIKVRGFYNAELPKKGYRLELSRRISLLGLRKDDDWQLFAMFLDLPHMRIKLSFDLWRSLESMDPTAILPDSKYVNLYINGKFHGIYLLAEKNDRRLYELSDPQNNIYSSLIFQAGSHETNFLDYSKDDWDQDWPNEDEGYFIMNRILTDLIEFVRNSNETEFFDSNSGIYFKFDKLNLIDFYLFNFFILHKDFWSQNYFLVRDDYPNKFFLIPWDFDSSFGQYLNRKYSSSEDPTSEIITRNYLYQRLLNNEEFRRDLKNRWFQLREELWTEKYVLDMISKMYKKINHILELDANIWYQTIFEDHWKEKLEESIDHLFEWIPKRFLFCDTYFFNL